MRRIILLSLVALPCLASGPKYVGTKTDPDTYQEFQNVYHDITNVISNGSFQGSPVGKLKKVAYTSTTSATTSTSSSFVDSALTLSYTPLSTSNTTYIFVTGDFSTNAAGNGYLTIYRDASNLGNGNSGLTSFFVSTGGTNRTPISMIAADIPNTVSAVTYKVRLRSADGTTTVSFPSGNVPQCFMVIFEVGS